MATEVRHFTVTVAPGSSTAAPQITNLPMPARIVRAVRVRVPPGPNGTVGFALGSAGVKVLPYNAGAWVVENDRDINWPLSGQIDSGAWQMFAYNTGTFAHDLQVTFELDTIDTRAAPDLLVPLVITP